MESEVTTRDGNERIVSPTRRKGVLMYNFGRDIGDERSVMNQTLCRAYDGEKNNRLLDGVWQQGRKPVKSSDWERRLVGLRTDSAMWW
jgi:hypothetical protein